MKINELQIGDWVKYMNTTPCEIVAIDGTATCRIRTLISDKIDEFGNKDYKAITTRTEDIVPLFLTPEILEKNGFVENSLCGIYEIQRIGKHIELDYANGITSGISINVTDDGAINTREVNISKYGCVYVHTFQHALRLCGLDELADNLKID